MGTTIAEMSAADAKLHAAIRRVVLVVMKYPLFSADAYQ
jgi:hypothetical protein